MLAGVKKVKDELSVCEAARFFRRDPQKTSDWCCKIRLQTRTLHRTVF